MVNSRVFIGSLAFGISFGIGLITSQNVGKATAAGLITVPATLVAVAVADRKNLRHAETRIATLKQHIYALQQRRAAAYQDYAALTAEKEQLLLAPHGTPIHALPAQTEGWSRQQKRLSWDLSASASASRPIPAYNLPTEIRELGAASGVSSPSTQAQDQLQQEIASLTAQKQHLETKTRSLQTEVIDLERCRVELEQFLSYAETKKRELETESNPVQIALKQLESQMATVQAELAQVEATIAQGRSEHQALEQAIAKLKHEQDLLSKTIQQRRNEKDSLEKTVNQYRAEKDSLEKTLTQRRTECSQLEARLAKLKQTPPESVEPEPKPEAKPDRRTESKSGTQPSSPAMAAAAQPADQGAQSVKSLQRPAPSPQKVAPSEAPPASQAAPLNGSPNLPQEWEELMVQLPDYEFQVLKAIAEQHNPAPIIKKIAEDNLTMPEVLLESINERALNLIGDLIIEPGATISSTMIAREYSKVIKKLIKTYEYLAK